ncbi:unnamed protein product [Durusdinium trenchii]|uniref:Uncharacterized protein n=1 Tax=Durusdinium trenchii TaxID=1381693 RepID=A0ABP0NJU7_9DINO
MIARAAARVGPRFWRYIATEGWAGTTGKLYFQSEKVPTSILSTGQVGTNRDLLGSDGEFFGTDPLGLEVKIADGRGHRKTLDENGFCLMQHTCTRGDDTPAGLYHQNVAIMTTAWNHIDYYDNEKVINVYYPECEALVSEATGASRVVAFDHNLRAKQRKEAGDRLRGGNAVQEPLVTYGVHNDYTLTSAAQRIRQLARPASKNDTQTKSLLNEAEVEGLLKKRWLFINVWRNVAETPVECFPLAACDAQSTAPPSMTRSAFKIDVFNIQSMV